MQPDIAALPLIRRVAAKEVTLFFTSPIAYLFLGTFAAVTLFVFFWGEAFFSRNIADVRPLFEWMPLLLVFLASTLTMRLWSEERRNGTLEHVLTQPVPLWYFVVGKFAGCLLLLAIALLITLPLPITVALLGDLDWGPVWAGYLATFLLGAAYLSIGLFVSARSDNQIVSLISATALCGAFYLVGSPIITNFFGSQAGEWLRLLGTGSRFESITRGVIDLRDLYYYLSIIAVFLVLNTYVLERERWAATGATPRHRSWRVITALLVANALGANLWLGQLQALRVDVTRGQLYSISPATREYLAQLQEPLLLRGYFSAKTHPLLAPLVPQLRDLLREYEVAGRGKVRVEIIDPATDPELEKEANEKYGIRPMPFQVADRYQSSIVSSYFDVLVQYGDQHEVMDFADLIEVKADAQPDLEVQLRNPEHDITSAIRKVLYAYQSGGNLFDTVAGKLDFEAYISANAALPESLVAFRKTVEQVADDMQAQSGGRMQVTVQDPDADGGKLARKINADYGFMPMTTSLLGQDQFYFYMTLGRGDQLVQIPLDDTSEAGFRRNMEAAIKRFASGFTKTVALVTPSPAQVYGGYNPPGASFNRLEAVLGSDLSIEREDLSDGRVSGNADILVLVAPENLGEKELFAVDQFLMQGGTVVAATSPYISDLSNRSLAVRQNHSGLEDWLAHNGLRIEPQLVMDPQNAAFPAPVSRDVGGFQVQEMQMLDYPYFVDVRSSGLDADNPVTADLNQVTMAWASPITVVPQEGESARKVEQLIHSSPGSWLSEDTNVMPRLDASGQTHYQPAGATGAQLLGVSASGRFESYFAGKPSPLLERADKAAGDQPPTQDGPDKATESTVTGVIEHSPEVARIILFSSNDFLEDQILQLEGLATGSEYLNPLQLVTNAVDWSLEDAGLLAIRGRGHFNRTLPPMEHASQLFWEYLNYGLAAAMLLIVALVHRQRQRRRQRHYLQLFTHQEA